MTWLSVVWTRAEASRPAASRAAADRLLAAEVAARTGLGVRVTRLCPACGSSAHGRPVLRGPVLAGPALPAVSISRGGGLTVVAVADTAGLGVDVEAVAAFADRSVARVLGERADDPEALATSWVRTEAALKAAGTGLAVDPATVRLGDPDRPPAVVAWPPGVVRPEWLRDLDLGAGLRAAAAGTGQAPVEVSVRQAAGRAAARGRASPP